jgi:hypothetical protein
MFMFVCYSANETAKARGLAQHGGPPGWLEESDPAGVILHVMDGTDRLSFLYSTGCADRSCPAASWGKFPAADI